ncbi:Photosynthetic reaction center cytochrome c subunit [Sphingomonas antarctica]|uniref:photosynthetic reaction center cytochrome PufC n=1 Tax=Sphingomonas antarctica TaxID=2040274 RepID=UPI0039E95E04
MRGTFIRGIVLVGALAGTLLISGCEIGPKRSQQTGYRGAGLQQVVDVKHQAKAAVIPAAPYPLPADGGPTAAQTYKNVKVLGDVSTERFNHLMAEISQWVAPPEQGCNYCHNPENMASDEKYTKVVARRMIQMTQNINSRWSTHVQQTGVTCYTCHRGNAVPTYKWALSEGTPEANTIRGNKRGQNTPDANVGYASLPYDPFAQYLNGNAAIRVVGNNAFPTGKGPSVKDAESSYGLMMHISTSLGVSCVYCHNSQSFRSWNLSRPQRATAYYGIRMVRDINEQYISSLQSVFPPIRKGPHGDPYKVNCMTCHQGLSKPLGGVSMIAQAPALKGTKAPAAPTAGSKDAVPAAFNAPVAMTAKTK